MQKERADSLRKPSCYPETLKKQGCRNIEKIGREAPELKPVEKSANVFSIKKIQAGSVKQESHAS